MIVTLCSGSAAGSYCSALHTGRLFAYQFHPERSGPMGLRIYRGFADVVASVRMSPTR